MLIIFNIGLFSSGSGNNRFIISVVRKCSFTFLFYREGLKYNKGLKRFLDLGDHSFNLSCSINLTFLKLDSESSVKVVDLSFFTHDMFAKVVTLELKLYRKSKKYPEVELFQKNQYLSYYKQFFRPIKSSAVSNKLMLTILFCEFPSLIIKLFKRYLLRASPKSSSFIIFIHLRYLVKKYSTNNMVVFFYISDYVCIIFPNGRISVEFKDKYDFINFLYEAHSNIWSLRHCIKSKAKFKLKLWRWWRPVRSHSLCYVVLQGDYTSEILKSSYSCFFKGYNYNIPFVRLGSNNCFSNSLFNDLSTYQILTKNTFVIKDKFRKTHKDTLKNRADITGLSINFSKIKKDVEH